MNRRNLTKYTVYIQYTFNIIHVPVAWSLMHGAYDTLISIT